MTKSDKKAVRRCVHSFFKRNEMPTLDKVLQATKENVFIPPMSRSTLFKVLKKLGFIWEKRGRSRHLLPGRDLGEHTKQKIWKDRSVKTARQAFVEDLSVGLKDPSGKGQRLIISYIGNESGFVEGGLLLFQSKNTGDYHEDMNAVVFEEWLTSIIPLLAENCVIVMENAPYHSVKLEKNPDNSL